MKKIKPTILLYMNCFLLLLFIIVTSLISSKYFVVAHDDMYNIFFNKNYSFFYNFFYDVDHGRYISNIFLKLQSACIDIHPTVWIRTYGVVIKSIFLFVFLILLSSSAFLFQKEKDNIKAILLPLFALDVFLIYQILVHGKYEDMLYTFFYGFIFPFIFFILFWNKLIYTYTQNINIKKKDIIYFSILAFLLGLSTEFTIFISFSGFIIIFCFDVITNNTSSRKYLVPFFIFVLASIFYIINPGFIESAQTKGTLNGLLPMLTTAYNVLPEFINDAFHIIKEKFLVITILIIITISFVPKMKEKENNLNFIKIILSLLFSTYLFYFLLIFAGRAPGHVLFTLHNSTNIQICIGLIYILFLSISFISGKKLYSIFFYIIFTLSVLFYNFHFPKYISELSYKGRDNYLSYGAKEIATKRYMFERILLFYASNNKDAILPKFYYGFPVNLNVYLENVYNIKGYNEENTKYINAEDAYNEYLKNGGEEIILEKGTNDEFQKLKDKYTNKTIKL